MYDVLFDGSNGRVSITKTSKDVDCRWCGRTCTEGTHMVAFRSGAAASSYCLRCLSSVRDLLSRPSSLTEMNDQTQYVHYVSKTDKRSFVSDCLVCGCGRREDDSIVMSEPWKSDFDICIHATCGDDVAAALSNIWDDEDVADLLPDAL